MSTLSVGTVKATTFQTAAGVEVYTCKAWVNFNGTGTPSIRASGNVSSITDNDTGNYTVNFTTAMPDANYCWTGSCEGQDGMGFGAYGMYVTQYFSTVPTSSALTIASLQDNNDFADSRYINVSVFR